MFSVSHEDVFIERSNRSEASSSPAWDMESHTVTSLLKRTTQTGINCVWILSRLNYIVLPNTREIEEICIQALRSGNISSACPVSREKARLKCVYLCVLLCVCLSHSNKRLCKMDSRHSRSLMLKAKQRDESGETPSAGNKHPPPSWRAPGLLSVILQSIRKGNMDGEHAAFSAWDSSWYALKPQIQSHKAARVARTAWPEVVPYPVVKAQQLLPLV